MRSESKVARFEFKQISTVLGTAMLAERALDQSHLLSLVSTIGQSSREGGYKRCEECVESLQDIQRFLQLDLTPEKRVAQCLVAWNLVSKDILPLLKNHGHDEDMVLHTLKVLVFLTLPTLSSLSEPLANQRSHQAIVADLLFDDISATQIILSIMCAPLRRFEDRASCKRMGDIKTVELVLTLIRNLILAASTHGRNSVFTQEEFLLKWFFDCSIDEIFVRISYDVESSCFREASFLILETLNCLCASKSGETILSHFHSSNGPDGEHHQACNFQTHGTSQTWVPVKSGNTARFSGKYQHSALACGKVKDIVTRKPHQPSFPRINDQHVSWSDTSRRFDQFLQRMNAGPLPTLLEAVLKSLYAPRESVEREEDMLHTCLFFQMLTYFMELGGSSKTLGESHGYRVRFAHIFTDSFVAYLKLSCATFRAASDLRGLRHMDRFIRIFTEFLLKESGSNSTQLRIASRSLANQLFGSRQEDSLSYYVMTRLKSSENKRASIIQISVLFENMHRINMLQREVGCDSVTPCAMKFCFDDVLLNKLSKCMKHMETLTDSTAAAVLFLLQEIVKTDREQLNHVHVISTYVYLAQNHCVKGCSSVKSTLLRFFADQVCQLLHRLQNQDSKGSVFVSSLFSRYTRVMA